MYLMLIPINVGSLNLELHSFLKQMIITRKCHNNRQQANLRHHQYKKRHKNTEIPTRHTYSCNNSISKVMSPLFHQRGGCQTRKDPKNYTTIPGCNWIQISITSRLQQKKRRCKCCCKQEHVERNALKTIKNNYFKISDKRISFYCNNLDI